MEKMNRNGFIYSIFAIFVLGLTASLVLTSSGHQDMTETGEKFRIDEVFYFLQSTTDDLGRASEIIGRRSLTALVNYVVSTGEYVSDSQNGVQEAFQNGTVNGTSRPLMNDSTIRDWTDSMQKEAGESGYNLNLTLINITVGTAEHLHFSLSASYALNLTDPITSVQFDRMKQVNTTISYNGIEDPFILMESAGRYANFFSACPSDTPVTKHATGADWFYNTAPNWTSGTAVVRESNGGISGVPDKAEKIAVVQDLCTYSQNDIENEFTQFAGVVSEAPAIDAVNTSSADVCGYDDVSMNAIIDDAGNATQITAESMAVMTEEQVWQNNIQNWTERGCYLPDPWGPTVWGRVEGRKTLNPSFEKGLAFFINVPDLPAELQKANTSAVDYVYFDESRSYGNSRKVKGVTNEDLDWFRLDQDHVGYWSMTALAYN